MLAQSGTQTQWLILVAGAFAVVYIFVLRPMGKKKKDPLEPKPFLSLSQQKVVEKEMQNLLVELSQMSRQVTAQLDTRAARLETLIQDADQRIETLKRLNDAPAAADFKVNQSPEESVASKPDPRYIQIYSLADGGKSVQEIAHELGRPRGEIELILALRR